MSRLNVPGHTMSGDKSAVPSTEHRPGDIRQQLDRILTHQRFKHSRRCANLLRYIVEHAIDGDGQLKERTLGIEVFGRQPNYDTNEDPVVRNTACEIRKRIAQYYHEPGHESELRIELPLGSYRPEFQLGGELTAREEKDAPRSSRPPEIFHRARLHSAIAKRCLAYFLLFTVAGAAAIGMARVKASVSSRPIEEFWAPLLDSSGQTLVVVGGPDSELSLNRPHFSVSEHLHGGDRIPFSDVNAVFRLTSLLGSRGRPARIQFSKTTSLTDLQLGPVVLICGIDNEWTMRIDSPLRYHLGFDGKRFGWIEDRQNPSRRAWLLDFGQEYSQLTRDYAIVSQFWDNMTGQPVVIAAGIGENGTMAAAEFLTDARQIEDATRNAPKNWRAQNIEFVITTQVINGTSARPRVLASYYWPR
jgi:hypothetical protein